MRTIQVLSAVLLLAGCARPFPAESPPAPRSQFPVHVYPATHCVIRDGRLAEVEIDPRDSTYHGQPIAGAFPVDSTYAEGAAWYRSSAPIATPVGAYVRYGLPRILGLTDVVPVTTFRNVTVFAEPSANLRRPDVVYIPTRPGCVFQPYTHGG